MRDPKRIPEVMNLIQGIWEKDKYQDMRFFQLIDNLQYEYVQWNGNNNWIIKNQVAVAYEGRVYLEEDSYYDLFYLEDDEFIKFLQWKLGDSDE